MIRFFKALSQFIEAFSNFAFYLLAAFIVLFPPLVGFNKFVSGRTGLLWVLITIACVIVLVVAIKPLVESLFDILERIRKGELLKEFFKPFRSIAAVLGVYGVSKVEYELVYGMEKLEFEQLMEFLWKFLTVF